MIYKDWLNLWFEGVAYNDGEYIPVSAKRVEKNIDLVKCNFVKFLIAHA